MSFAEISGDNHERGTALGSRESREVPGGQHDEAGLHGDGKIPTLTDRFDPTAGTGHDSTVELATGNPAQAQPNDPSAAIDPTSLATLPLAPDAMTAASPIQLTSFLTKYL
ncbi:hypothetical protein ABT272_39510 [Streptomyces sp900105245]|uniref:Uncharacterized protein n=1 Tax=Streptomyces sp. 900105245 TaxID=3154379 RepID=A0ABV1UKE0_9ACTN